MRTTLLLICCLLVVGSVPALADDAEIAQAIELAAESLRGDEVQYETDIDVMGFPATVGVEGFAFCMPEDPTAPPMADPVPPANIYGCVNDIAVEVVSSTGSAAVTMMAPLLFVDCRTHVISDGTGYVTCTAQIDFEVLIDETDGCPTLTLVPGSLVLTTDNLEGEFTDTLITLYWAVVAPLMQDMINDQAAEFEVMAQIILAQASEMLCDVVAVGDEVPGIISGTMVLHQNAPNPFNPRTTVSFTLSQAQEVELYIFDMTGKRIAILADRLFEAGTHSMDWDGRDFQGNGVSSGTYLLRVEGAGGVASTKMMLLR